MRPKSKIQFGRLLVLAFQNLSRNFFLSLATTFMMGLILFILNVVVILNALAQNSISQIETQVDIIVYLQDDIPSKTLDEIMDDIRSIPVVTELTYTSKEEALQEFLDKNPDKVELFAEYEFENMLPASLTILTESPSQHQMVLDYLEDSNYQKYLKPVQDTDENLEISQRLSGIIEFSEKLIIGVLITFLVGSILMIVNAIHLSIFTRQKEIQIMQLVGARSSMIHIPFLIEGMIYSVIAMVFSTGLTLLFLNTVNLISSIQEITPLPLWQLLGIEFGTSILVGLVASLFALSYYLRRNSLVSDL